MGALFGWRAAHPWALGFVGALFACSAGSAVTPDGGGDGGPVFSVDLALPSCSGLASLDSIRASILPRCAGFGCHRTAPFAGGLDLTDANVYASLVNVPATAQAAPVRVAPGAPLDSFLWRKLDNVLSIDHSQGQPMPLGAENFWAPLSGEQRALVYCWIAAGAPSGATQ